jgi:hypothetical protein
LSHISEEWNLEQECCENLDGDLFQDPGIISSVEWKNNSTHQEACLNKNQTENKSCGLPRCIIIIGFDKKLLNIVKTNL